MIERGDVFRVEGQSALVTGGGSGIGLAIAEGLAASGARVALVGRREDVLREAADRVAGVAVPADVTDLQAIPAVVRRCEEAVGPLSILVHAAGIHHKADAVDTPDDAIERVVRTHMLAGLSLAREAARGMLDRGRGSVVFIGSMAAVFGIPKVSAYTAAKGGLTALVPALATEWGARGVRVNIVQPGWIETEMSAKAFAGDPARKQKVLSRTPLNRLGQPRDVANAVVYLCSDAAAFVTGTNLVVDGGASIGF